MAVARLPKRIPLGLMRRECPICSSPDLKYEFIIEGFPACSCQGCSLLFLNPHPEPASEPEPAMSQDAAKSGDPDVYDLHAATAAELLDHLVRYAGVKQGRLLLVNATPELAAEAQRRGFDVATASVGALERGYVSEAAGTVQACLMYRALETASEPVALLETLRRFLTPGGSLMVVAPTLDSRTARLFRSHWWEFKKDTRFYFSADTLQNLLMKAGYGDPIILRDPSVVSLHYMRKKLAAMPSAWRYRLMRFVLALAPGFLRHRAFRFLHSRTAIIVRSTPRPAVPVLSVIMPVYNERTTFVPVMERVLAKNLNGLDIQVILVESNSVDGTREQVLQYAEHPRVTVILEERARGKGHAVRQGLAAATGDVILIQDADLEYDIDDYDSLVAPIVGYQQNFVIGSRHILKGRVWKIREFNDAAGLAAVFNFGHLVFLTLFNLIYQQKLKDPFSMFKVFRRECLYGLTFECDRFDFDFEITIKLLRKGYRPLELPVNYKARSFSEGKKVTVVRDPLTWIRALVKFRTSPLYGGSQSS